MLKYAIIAFAVIVTLGGFAYSGETSGLAPHCGWGNSGWQNGGGWHGGWGHGNYHYGR